MSWNIAEAKQHFSEVVKLAVAEPQAIYNRATLVAAVVGAEEYRAFEEWRHRQAPSRTLADDFAQLRQLLLEEGIADGLELPPRSERPNAFAELLDEEYPDGVPD